jgi:hypothetical protein
VLKTEYYGRGHRYRGSAVPSSSRYYVLLLFWQAPASMALGTTWLTLWFQSFFGQPSALTAFCFMPAFALICTAQQEQGVIS